MQKITPFLWFDANAEEAVAFYASIFPNSAVQKIHRYGKDSPGTEGTVMVIEFTLNGVTFNALNGGPVYRFNPAISFVVSCEDQAEVDHYWEHLTTGGQEDQCGWLTDKFGVSWQIVPKALDEMLADPDPQKAYRAMQAMLKMVKLDIAELQKAFDQE
jgi:predicted 3-demethylubiquinone-9 3-methyltransferase (glyoxalase superfamily)